MSLPIVKILIKSCKDPQKWYANKVGEFVPYLGTYGNEYKSLQDEGVVVGHRFVNFVDASDGILVEEDHESD